jgi:hypothetical protein
MEVRVKTKFISATMSARVKAVICAKNIEIDAERDATLLHLLGRTTEDADKNYNLGRAASSLAYTLGLMTEPVEEFEGLIAATEALKDEDANRGNYLHYLFEIRESMRVFAKCPISDRLIAAHDAQIRKSAKRHAEIAARLAAERPAAVREHA